MIFKKSLMVAAAATVLGSTAVAAAIGTTAAASATNTNTGSYTCPPSVLTNNTSGITTKAGGKAELSKPPYPAEGIVFTTGASNDDAVTWRQDIPAGNWVDIDKVKSMSYRTKKLDTAGPGVNDAALPAFRVHLDVPSVGDVTLVYEPYYQIVGNPPRNVETGWELVPNGKFWSNKTIPGLTAEGGGSYAGNKTWAEIAAANPQARVKGYSIGLGTYNTNTIGWFNQVHFEGKGQNWNCSHSWKQPTASPSVSTTVKPSSSVSASPSASAAKSVGVTVSPTNTAGPTLPVTGQNTNVAALAGGVGLAMLLAGVIGVVISRQRRRRFAAPDTDLE